MDKKKGGMKTSHMYLLKQSGSKNAQLFLQRRQGNQLMRSYNKAG